MSRVNTSRPSWIRRGRPPVDDAYTAWLNAHGRCAQALRVWRSAKPAGRAAAHRAYLAELELEEAAARELERLHIDLRTVARGASHPPPPTPASRGWAPSPPTSCCTPYS